MSEYQENRRIQMLIDQITATLNTRLDELETMIKEALNEIKVLSNTNNTKRKGE